MYVFEGKRLFLEYHFLDHFAFCLACKANFGKFWQILGEIFKQFFWTPGIIS